MFICVASGKGGVGKTTSALAVAAVLREAPWRADPLVIDCDPGADATWSLGFEPDNAALDVLRGTATVAESEVRSEEGLRLLCASPELATLERGVDAGALRALGAAEAYVVADTAPGFASRLTQAALGAADVVLVPFLAEPLAQRRATHVLAILEALGAAPLVFGVAIMPDARRGLTADVLEAAAESGLVTIGGGIPRSVLVPEAGNAAQSVVAYAPHSAVAEAYRGIVVQLQRRARKK